MSGYGLGTLDTGAEGVGHILQLSSSGPTIQTIYSSFDWPGGRHQRTVPSSHRW